MTPLSLTSLQLSLDTLLNTTSSRTYSTSSGTDIWDIITDQYLSSSLSSAAKMTDLSGLYNAQGTSIQSLLESQKNTDILELISASLSSQQQSVPSILSADSLSNEADNYKVLIAINRAAIGNPLVLLGEQDSSLGDILDLYA